MESFKYNIGFSTGSIAFGDFKAGVSFLIENKIKVVELSALRESELTDFCNIVDELDLSYFEYISFHAPSKFNTYKEKDFVEILTKISKRNWLIIVHPDIITDYNLWKQLGENLCIENMDKRKHFGRTTLDLENIFNLLPEATFCFDLAHARQVDSTMAEASLMLLKFSKRLRQIHLSDVNSESKHESLSLESLLAYGKLFESIPNDIPVIIESPVSKQNILSEIKIASYLFDTQKLIDFVKPYSYDSNYFLSYIEHVNHSKSSK
jgi:hypothetical protein